MKAKIFAMALAAAVLGCAGGARQAVAWDGFYGGGWLYPGYNLYASDTVPYFALHPPVYYSRPVARPYGYSPFPYPPYVMTPDPKMRTPVLIRNPYVSAVEPGEGPQPLRIVNPYVTAVEQ